LFGQLNIQILNLLGFYHQKAVKLAYFKNFIIIPALTANLTLIKSLIQQINKMSDAPYADLLVIGLGAMGSSIFYHASQTQKSVFLLILTKKGNSVGVVFSLA
jgi:hypothetical protein